MLSVRSVTLGMRCCRGSQPAAGWLASLRALRYAGHAVPLVAALAAMLLVGTAGAQAAGPVYVSVNAGGNILEIRPSAMHLVSNENLARVRWSSWGGRYATGRATDYANGPSPGHSRKNPVRVRLEGRRRCAGTLVYTVVRLRFTRGVPYAGQPRVTRYRYGCPPT